jgi:hypothetical protein
MNETPKYVVSGSLHNAEWNNSTVLGPYSAEAIRGRKSGSTATSTSAAACSASSRTASGQDPTDGLAHAEFRIRDDQDGLGLVDRQWSPSGAATDPGRAAMYWHVDGVAAAFEMLLSMGCTRVPADHAARRRGARNCCRGRPLRERAWPCRADQRGRGAHRPSARLG